MICNWLLLSRLKSLVIGTVTLVQARWHNNAWIYWSDTLIRLLAFHSLYRLKIALRSSWRYVVLPLNRSLLQERLRRLPYNALVQVWLLIRKLSSILNLLFLNLATCNLWAILVLLKVNLNSWCLWAQFIRTLWAIIPWHFCLDGPLHFLTGFLFECFLKVKVCLGFLLYRLPNWDSLLLCILL